MASFAPPFQVLPPPIHGDRCRDFPRSYRSRQASQHPKDDEGHCQYLHNFLLLWQRRDSNAQQEESRQADKQAMKVNCRLVQKHSDLVVYLLTPIVQGWILAQSGSTKSTPLTSRSCFMSLDTVACIPSSLAIVWRVSPGAFFPWL